MPDEQVPFMQKKVGGIPVWIIVIGGVALLAYWYFQHQSSAAATTSGLKTTGGGGSAKTGKVVVQKGAVSINVRQGRRGEGEDDDEDNDQPKPPVHHRRPTHHTRPNPYDVPHGPRRVTQAQARYAISHNRPVYTKGGKNGWTKQSSANRGGDTYWVGSEVYDWLRDAGQIKGANQAAQLGV